MSKRGGSDKSIHELLLNPPKPSSSLKNIKIIAIALIVALFSIALISSYTSYTGYTISESSKLILDTTQEVNSPYKVLEISKDSNSVLNIEVNSNININVFAETSECSDWKSSGDKNNQVLYAVNNIKQAKFNVGNPAENTLQQLELYQTDDLCLIFINKEHPSKGKVSMKITQIQKDAWNVI